MKHILAHSITAFQAHNNARSAAAIAFYMIFCLAPIFLFLIGVLGAILVNVDVDTTFFTALKHLFGNEAVEFLHKSLSQQSLERSTLATAVGLFFALLGASAVFKELKCALNTIFNAPEQTGGMLNVVSRNFATFSALLIVGFFLTVSLLATMAASIIGTYFHETIALDTRLLEVFNFSVSFIVLTVFFMFLHSFVSDAKVPVRITILGSVVTAFLFTIAKTLFGLYLGTFAVASGYGAAGSVLVLLLWLSYSAQIFLLGAEITAQLQKKEIL